MREEDIRLSLGVTSNRDLQAVSDAASLDCPAKVLLDPAMPIPQLILMATYHMITKGIHATATIEGTRRTREGDW